MTPNNRISRFMAREIHPLSFIAEPRVQRTPEIRRHANIVLAAIEFRLPPQAPSVVSIERRPITPPIARPAAPDAVQVGRQKRDHRMIGTDAMVERMNRDYRFHTKRRHGHQVKLSFRDRGAYLHTEVL